MRAETVCVCVCQDMENKIRSTLNEIYFGKTKDIVNGLRYVCCGFLLDLLLMCLLWQTGTLFPQATASRQSQLIALLRS